MESSWSFVITSTHVVFTTTPFEFRPTDVNPPSFRDDSSVMVATAITTMVVGVAASSSSCRCQSSLPGPPPPSAAGGRDRPPATAAAISASAGFRGGASSSPFVGNRGGPSSSSSSSAPAAPGGRSVRVHSSHPAADAAASSPARPPAGRPVRVRLRHRVQFGEELRLVGGLPQLGSWDPHQVRMHAASLLCFHLSEFAVCLPGTRRGGSGWGPFHPDKTIADMSAPSAHPNLAPLCRFYVLSS